MADKCRVHPEMALLKCETMKPERMEPIKGTDIELVSGAVGVGAAVVGDGEPMLFLSLHGSDGEVLFARLDMDEMQAFIALMANRVSTVARFIPGLPAELVN